MTCLSTTVPKPKRHTMLHTVRAWLAIFAILAQGLLPVGSAVAATLDDGATEIIVCTANGIQSIALDENGAPVEPKTQGACPFCILHVTAIPSEQNFDTTKIHFVAQATTVTWSPIHHRPVTVWRATPAPSRAPPSFS